MAWTYCGKQIITLIGHGQWVNIARAVLLFIWWKDNFTVQIILQHNFVIMKKKILEITKARTRYSLTMYYVPWHFFFKRLNKNSYCTYLNMILRKINLNHFQFLEVVENHKSQCYNFDTKILYIFGRCCRNQGGWNLSRNENLSTFHTAGFYTVSNFIFGNFMIFVKDFVKLLWITYTIIYYF